MASAPTFTVTPGGVEPVAFAFAAVFEPGLDGGPIAAGDFGADGIPDVVVGALDGARLTVFRGEGGGTVQPAGGVEFDLAGGFSHLVAADVNLDGQLDVVGSVPPADRVVVALGNGQHGLAVGPEVVVESPGALLVRDLNRDGFPDLVVTGAREGSVFAGRGGGSFDPVPIGVVDSGTRASALVLLDITADGFLDLVLALPDLNTIRLYRGDGDGGFAPLGVRSAREPEGLAVGDFNGDGIDDLAVADLDGVGVYLGFPGGLATEPLATAGVPPRGVHRADLNGDGFADLLGLDPTGHSLVTWAGRGDGGFEVFVSARTDFPGRAVALLDLDGNRLPDTISTGAAEIIVGDNNTPLRFLVGDVDRNGVVDAADLDALRGEIYDGDGAGADSCGGGRQQSDAGADVNGDGHIDAADIPALIQLL
jgi:hypothetical protein